MSKYKFAFLISVVLIILGGLLFLVYKHKYTKNSLSSTNPFCNNSMLVKEKVSPEVKTVVEQGLPRFLKNISDQDLNDFGFQSREELNKSSLGEPAIGYAINVSEILKVKNISDSLCTTNTVYFPVEVSGEARMFAKAFLDAKRKWSFGIGDSSMAKQWAYLIKTYPPAQGYKHYLIIVTEKDSSFYLIENSQKSPIIVFYGPKDQMQIISRNDLYQRLQTDGRGSY